MTPQAQVHKRKYGGGPGDADALWQLDLVAGSTWPTGGSARCCPASMIIPGSWWPPRWWRCPRAGRCGCVHRGDVQYGVPAEVLTDNGKQFTGRFTNPRPAEVLFERVCREHGITAKLTRPYWPTTTGKIVCWHQTLRRELLDPPGRSRTCPASRRRSRPGCTPITISGRTRHSAWPPRPACSGRAPRRARRPGRRDQRLRGRAAGPAPVLLGAQSAGAVEFDTVISPGGVLGVIPAVQRIRLGGPGPGSSPMCGPMSSPCTCSTAASWAAPAVCRRPRLSAGQRPAQGPQGRRRLMVTRQRPRVGASYAGKIVTVHVEDTHFRITCDGAEISLHPRAEQRPVTRWKAKIHAPKAEPVSSIS